MSNRLSALEQEATQRGYRLIIGQTRRNPHHVREYLDDFFGRNVDGVLCLLDLMRGDEDALAALFDPAANLVFHGKPLVQGAGCVRVDTGDGVQTEPGASIPDAGVNGRLLSCGIWPTSGPISADRPISTIWQPAGLLRTNGLSGSAEG